MLNDGAGCILCVFTACDSPAPSMIKELWCPSEREARGMGPLVLQLHLAPLGLANV